MGRLLVRVPSRPRPRLRRGRRLPWARVQPAADVLRAATTTAARLIGREGQLGVVAPGAEADLLVVDGDPIADISVLTRPETHLLMIVQGGRLVRDLR